MSDQDEKGGKARPEKTSPEKISAKKTGAATPKRRNPGLEVVNVYGSGPLPIGERPPEKEEHAKAKPKRRGALSTSLEGKD